MFSYAPMYIYHDTYVLDYKKKKKRYVCTYVPIHS